MGKEWAKKLKNSWKRVWHFLWEEDSLLSWIANVILAFVLIKFVVYPLLGFLLSTSYPVVAVVSSSMEHRQNFDEYWQNGGAYYENLGISKEKFKTYRMHNGFNKGDIIVLKGKQPENIPLGEVIVFWSHEINPKQDPIIHRVIEKWDANGDVHFRTKGDNWRINTDSLNGCSPTGCIDETDITEERVLGTALFKIPFLGYIKIWFVELINMIVR